MDSHSQLSCDHVYDFTWLLALPIAEITFFLMQWRLSSCSLENLQYRIDDTGRRVNWALCPACKVTLVPVQRQYAIRWRSRSWLCTSRLVKNSSPNPLLLQLFYVVCVSIEHRTLHTKNFESPQLLFIYRVTGGLHMPKLPQNITKCCCIKCYFFLKTLVLKLSLRNYRLLFDSSHPGGLHFQNFRRHYHQNPARSFRFFSFCLVTKVQDSSSLATAFAKKKNAKTEDCWSIKTFSTFAKTSLPLDSWDCQVI